MKFHIKITVETKDFIVEKEGDIETKLRPSFVEKAKEIADEIWSGVFGKSCDYFDVYIPGWIKGKKRR